MVYPKTDEDCNMALKCMDMIKCKTHNVLVKRMWYI